MNPLERNHLRYLLMKDPEIKELRENQQGIWVGMSLFLYGFGLFNHNIDQIKELEEDIRAFRENKGEAIMTLFIGAVNHWVTLVIHKEADS